MLRAWSVRQLAALVSHVCELHSFRNHRNVPHAPRSSPYITREHISRSRGHPAAQPACHSRAAAVMVTAVALPQLLPGCTAMLVFVCASAPYTLAAARPVKVVKSRTACQPRPAHKLWSHTANADTILALLLAPGTQQLAATTRSTGLPACTPGLAPQQQLQLCHAAT